MQKEKPKQMAGSGKGAGLKALFKQINASELSVLGAGLFFTLIIFMILRVVSVNNTMQENDYLKQNAAQTFYMGAQKLDFALQSISNRLDPATVVSFPEQISAIHGQVKGLDRFHYLVYIYKTPEGRWTYKTKSIGPSFSANPQAQNFVTSSLIQNVIAYAQKKDANTINSFLVSVPTEFQSLAGVPSLILAKKMESSALPGPAYLVGITDMLNIFPEYWGAGNARILSLRLEEEGNTYQNWHWILSTDFDGDKSQEGFMLNMWQGDYSLYINVQNFSYFSAGSQIPYFILLFGLGITGLAFLYVRENHRKASAAQQSYNRLGQKNSYLKKEIDEREKINKSLQQAEKENRAIIDAVSDIIFETNTKGEILFLNGAWRKVTGFDAEQSMEQDLFSMLHPQDQKTQKNDFMLMVKGQKQAYRSFTRLRTSDGTFRAVEIAFSMIRQDRNRELRVVGSFTDVEERRRAERALSEAEKKYRAIVENAAGGIYQLTPEGIYLSANPAMARILGYDTPEQILREIKNANTTLYCNTQERLSLIKKLHNEMQLFNHETQMRRKDGSVIWVNENIRVVRDDTGNILYFEGSIADITQRKESEIALKEAKINSDLANRAKSEFLANMSHELRTPLNSIIGFSEIIKDEVFGEIQPRSYWEYAKDINSSGQSLLTIINEILDISKIEAGERQLNESIVDLKDIVHACLDLLSGKIEKNDMQVIKALDDVPKIIGEDIAVKQIFMNLISNAIKFTPSGGRLTISYDVSTKGELSVSFTDTGIGLDDAEISKALSPFGQADNELSRSNSGTGLGLTLVDALTKLHDGRFELFSEKGIGTTATVIFPVDRVTIQMDDKKENGQGETQAVSGDGDGMADGADIIDQQD